MHLPVAKDMSGSLPTSVLTESILEERAPRFVDTYEKGDRTTSEARPIPSPVDSKLLEKLEALGYIERDH
jgi:hypothetical protein